MLKSGLHPPRKQSRWSSTSIWVFCFLTVWLGTLIPGNSCKNSLKWIYYLQTLANGIMDGFITRSGRTTNVPHRIDKGKSSLSRNEFCLMPTIMSYENLKSQKARQEEKFWSLGFWNGTLQIIEYGEYSPVHILWNCQLTKLHSSRHLSKPFTVYHIPTFFSVRG